MRSQSEREAWGLVATLSGMLKEAVDYAQHRPRCSYYSYPTTCSCGYAEWMQDMDEQSETVERIATKP